MKKLFMMMSLSVLAGCSMVRPDYLKQGDRVAVISPSFAGNMEKVEKGMEELRSLGLEPVSAPNLGKRCRGNGSETASNYAGTVEERTADLKWALEDGSIKAIVCARGGYGAIHLLQSVPSSLYARNPKWIVGYSDITSLHAACLKAGVMSIHGNSVSSLSGKGFSDPSNKALADLLFGKVPEYDVAPHPFNCYGETTGKLVGGNMITWEVLNGTDYDMMDAGSDLILLIEEVEETMHACDRLFNMLLMSGKMSRVKGIIFGEFTDCPSDLPYDSVEEMLYQYTSKLGIPVCCGFPAGHGKENFPLVEGASVTLTVDKEGSHLKFNNL